MYKGNTVGVVVPAYNEEGFVGEVIETMPEFVDRIYAIDDRSTDDTWAEIQEYAERANERVDHGAVADGGTAFPRQVVPIRHEENRGVGASIKTGYEHARADGIDATAVMAGDAQMDPDMLDALLDPVVEGDADYAKGNRLLFREYREDMSSWRFFGNSLLTVLTKIASGYWKTMDPQNGYTVISLRALERVRVEDVYDDYGFANALLVRLNANDMRVADVAMPAVYGDEQSSIKYSTFVPKLSSLLLRSFLWRLKTKYLVLDFHPLVFLYGLGAAGAGAGVLSALRSGVSAVDEDTGSGGSAFMTMLVSGVCFALAMILDMKENEDLETQVVER